MHLRPLTLKLPQLRLYPSLVILACLLFGSVLGLFIGCSRSSGRLELVPAAASIVFDTKGREVGRFFALENREPIPLSQIPEAVREAIIAVEDARFYSHRGVDFRAIARAAWADIRGGRYVEGGEPMDKAGSYAIQGRGALFVDRVVGCFHNVIGLPLSLLWDMLKEVGVDLLG